MCMHTCIFSKWSLPHPTQRVCFFSFSSSLTSISLDSSYFSSRYDNGDYLLLTVYSFKYICTLNYAHVCTPICWCMCVYLTAECESACVFVYKNQYIQAVCCVLVNSHWQFVPFRLFPSPQHIQQMFRKQVRFNSTVVILLFFRFV